MIDLSPDEMLAAIKRSLTETSGRFQKKLIINEGVECWGISEAMLLDTFERLGWRPEGKNWRPAAGMGFRAAYDILCDQAIPAPGMSRESMQPLMEGSYPDGVAWIEQFGSHDELRIDGDGLIFSPAQMTPVAHIGFLMRQAEKYYLIGAGGIARELQDRAEEIRLENGGATDGQWRPREPLPEAYNHHSAIRPRRRD